MREMDGENVIQQEVDVNKVSQIAQNSLENHINLVSNFYDSIVQPLIKQGKSDDEIIVEITPKLDQQILLISQNVQNFINRKDLSLPEKQAALAEQIPAEYKSNERIARFINSVEVAAKTAIGQKYIDFAMNSPEGKEVKLSDFISKNKYTLIDFWASWCGPCKAEMPNVIAAYKEFNKKGFGIVGVSLDNDETKWKEAIKSWGMTWPMMSDLKGWNCEGASLYGVRSIPATVLVNQEGTIIARNLRGEAIKEKLSELLK